MTHGTRALAALGVVLAVAMAYTQTSSAQGADSSQDDMLQDGNPADLFVSKGEELWKTKRGPNNVSLEKCDLGLGPGVVKGAYVQLPRFFKDAGKVQDLESRLVTCMVKQQGFSRQEAEKNHFSSDGADSDMEALVAYVVSQSHGMKINVPQGDPREREAYKIGEQAFFFRAGPHDFSCATCHSQTGKRIRLQSLPNLTDSSDSQKVYSAWPAYRLSQGTVRSMEYRIYDCLRQQRMPPIVFGSDLAIALTEYMAKNGDGGVFAGPGIKR